MSEEEDVIDTIEVDPVDEVGEETIIKNTTQPSDSPIDYSNHPKIKQILRNPDVKEVHIRFRRNRMVYVCIVFLDGSSIERPLIDIEDEEEPICPSRDPDQDYYRPVRRDGRRRGSRGTDIEPQRRGSRWNFLRMKNRGQQTDIASIVENNENITVKRIVTVVRKGCSCEDGGHQHSRRRRIPIEYEADYDQ